jgi:exosortase/archaeosortase family protein
MRQSSKRSLGLFARYFALIILGINNLYIIYAILTPLTIYATTAILSIFTDPTLVDNFISLSGIVIEIAPACVAGAAFYLLLILTLSVPDVKPITRTKAILTALIILFSLNILRILILIPLIKTAHFQTIHWIIWHLISTLFVVGTWLTVITIYKIKSIPIYSDLKYLYKSIKKPKRKK